MATKPSVSAASSLPRRSIQEISRDAATRASWRRPIGVAPAWSARPRTVMRRRVIPAMPVTTPTANFRDSSSRACSMCSSTEAAMSPGRSIGPGRASARPPMRTTASARVSPPGPGARIIESVRVPAQMRLPTHDTPYSLGSSAKKSTTHSGWRSATPLSASAARDLEPRHDARDAVEPAAFGHRVGMRSDDDGRQARRGARPRADQIGRAVQGDGKADAFHLGTQPIAPLQEQGREGTAGVGAAGIGDPGQRLDPPPQAIRVDGAHPSVSRQAAGTGRRPPTRAPSRRPRPACRARRWH